MTKRYNFELWHSVEKEFLKVTTIEDNGFLTGKSDERGFFCTCNFSTSTDDAIADRNQSFERSTSMF